MSFLPRFEKKRLEFGGKILILFKQTRTFRCSTFFSHPSIFPPFHLQKFPLDAARNFFPRAPHPRAKKRARSGLLPPCVPFFFSFPFLRFPPQPPFSPSVRGSLFFHLFPCFTGLASIEYPPPLVLCCVCVFFFPTRGVPLGDSALGCPPVVFGGRN